MHVDAGRERERHVEQIAAEGHAAAEVAVRPEVLQRTRARRGASPAPRARSARSSSSTIRASSTTRYGRAALAGEQLAHERQLVREPDVVLVGEHDRVAARVADGVLEVARAGCGTRFPRGSRIRGSPNGAHDRDRLVGGAVVRDDELVAGLELLEDRRDLPLDEAGAVEGRHADRDHAPIVLPRHRPVRRPGGPVGVARRGYNPAMPDGPVGRRLRRRAEPSPPPVDVDALFQSLREEVRRSGADPGGGGRPRRPARRPRRGRAALARLGRPLAAPAPRRPRRARHSGQGGAAQDDALVRRAARVRPALVQRGRAPPRRRPPGAGRPAAGRAGGACATRSGSRDADRRVQAAGAVRATAAPRSSPTRSSSSSAARGHEAEIVSVPFKWYPGTRVLTQAFTLAAARPDRERRQADRHGRRDEVPVLRRAAPREARLARAPVPAGVRARPHRRSGSSARAPEDRALRRKVQELDRVALGEATPPLRHLRQRRRPARSARRASSPRCCRIPAQALDYHDDGPRDFILSVNRLDRAKRVDLLIEAAALEPSLEVVVVGEGPDRERLEAARARPRRRRRGSGSRAASTATELARPLRHLLRLLLRAGRRGLRPRPVRVVPLRQAGDHRDRRRRAARRRPRRLDRPRRRPRGRPRSPRRRSGCATTPTRRRPSAAPARRSPPRSRGTARSGGCSREGRDLQPDAARAVGDRRLLGAAAARRCASAARSSSSSAARRSRRAAPISASTTSATTRTRTAGSSRRCGARPGVVVLHDFVLHHLVAGLTIGRRDGHGYLDAMEREGGVVGRLLGHAVLDKRIPPLWENRPRGLPPRRRGARPRHRARSSTRATSTTAPARRATTRPIWIVPHPAFPVPTVAAGRGRRRAALRHVRQRQREQARAAAARGVRARAAASTREPACCSSAPPRPASTSTGGCSGSASTAPGSCARATSTSGALWELMIACDVHVNLRSPTMGETSGTAIRALALGKPLVVSDVGWFSELPDDVALKVPVDDDEVDDARRPRSSCSPRAPTCARRWARPRSSSPRSEHDLDRVADLYVAAFEQAAGRRRGLRRRPAGREPGGGRGRDRARLGRGARESRPASARSSSVADRLRAVPAWAWLAGIVVALVRRPRLARARDARPVHHGRRAHLLGDGEELRLRPRLRRPRRAGARLRRRLPDPDRARLRALRPHPGRLRGGEDDQQPRRCRSPRCPRTSSPGGSSAQWLGAARGAARGRACRRWSTRRP